MNQVNFTLNGTPRVCSFDEDRILLEYLRNDLGLIGAKQSCDRKGQCGACTVIVNKKAVRACLTRMKKLDGADVITIEGLGTSENPHLIQHAFCLSGAIQCGFCTPGMIMATKALLDDNPDPDDAAIKRALARNLCRCTGYAKIISAVKLAGSFIRGESSPDEVRPAAETPVGVSLPRPTSMFLATGSARFAADIKKEGTLEVAVVRSPHAHAKIVSINTAPAETMPGVVAVMTSEDIKGNNRYRDDQPLLCEDKVHVMGDAVAIVIAETRQQALEAVEAVDVEYESLPVVETVELALADDAPKIHDPIPNLCYTHPQIKGDAKRALAESEVIVESDFSTQLIHQSPLEPEASIAYWDHEEDEEPQLVVVGRSIYIHYHLSTLQDAVGWENMRYEQAYIGGQFGIKMDITTEGIAAAAALHVKRPARYVCSLTESMWITTKRHPFHMKLKLGANRDGKLTALSMDFTVENGAYVSAGKSIVNRALYMLSGSYDIPNVDAVGRLVYTNNAWGGAARGAGPPQVNFALESAMELMAAKLVWIRWNSA